MVLILLIFVGLFLVSAFINNYKVQEADFLNPQFFKSGDIFNSISVKVNFFENVPIGEARIVKKNVTKVKYKWITNNEVIFFCPITLYSYKSMKPPLKYHAFVENGIASVTGRYSKGWMIHKYLIVLGLPAIVIPNLLFYFKAGDLFFTIIFGVPIYIFMLWQLKKEPLLDMERGIKYIVDDIKGLSVN